MDALIVHVAGRRGGSDKMTSLPVSSVPLRERGGRISEGVTECVFPILVLILFVKFAEIKLQISSACRFSCSCSPLLLAGCVGGSPGTV